MIRRWAPEKIDSEEGEGLCGENSLSPRSPSPCSPATMEGVVEDSYEDWQGSCEEALDDEDYSFEEWDYYYHYY